VTCGIPLEFEIEAATDDGTFNRSFELPTGADPVRLTVLVDDVESGAGDWTTGGDGAASWQITEEASHSPTHAWTEGVISGTQYVNNADNWFQSPVYDFSSFSSVTLSFWHIYDLETNWDFGNIEVSRDGGTTWELVTAYTSLTPASASTLRLTPIPSATAGTLTTLRFMAACASVGCLPWIGAQMSGPTA
jgi:hypothetical protein